MEKRLSSLFYRIRDDKSSNLMKGLNEILESRDSEWNYRCASMCLDDTRIPPTQRPSHAIKHAKVFFENLDYEFIVRFLNKVSRKPAYQEFIKSEYVAHYSGLAYQKYLKEQEEKRIREERRKEAELEFLRSIPHVEELTEAQKYSRLFKDDESLEEKSVIVAAQRVPYFSYKYVKEVLKTTKMPQEVKKALVMPHAEFVFASGDESLEEKSAIVVEARVPYFSYKYVKEVLKTTKMPQEVKKALVMPHVEFVFASGDESAIYKLGKILQHKPVYQEYVEEKRKVRVRVPQE